MRLRDRGLGFAPALALLPLGCGEPDPPVAADAFVGEVPELALEEEFRLGEGRTPEDVLTPPRSPLLAPDGRLAVLQPQDRELRLYREDGELARVVGGEGEGPGEFSSALAAAVDGDSIVVLDPALGRIQWFSLAGEFLGSRTWTPEPVEHEVNGATVIIQPQSAADLAVLEDGFAARPIVAFPGMGADIQPGFREEIRPAPFFRLTPDGRVADTLAWLDARSPDAYVEHDGAVLWLHDPFSQASLAALARDGRGVHVVSRVIPQEVPPEATFELQLLAGPGDTAWARTIGYEPRPMDGDAVETVLADVRPVTLPGAALDGEPPGPGELRSLLEDLGAVPAAVPAVTDLAAAGDGSVWLALGVPGEGARPWLGVDGDGEVVGRVELGAREQVADFDGERLVTVERDELDVPYVTSHRVRR